MGGGGLQLPGKGLKLAGKSHKKGCGAVKKPHQVKGSEAAKNHMASWELWENNNNIISL